MPVRLNPLQERPKEDGALNPDHEDFLPKIYLMGSDGVHATRRARFARTSPNSLAFARQPFSAQTDPGEKEGLGVRIGPSASAPRRANSGRGTPNPEP